MYISSWALVFNLALALTLSLNSDSLSGILNDKPAFFKPNSNIVSELTNFKPEPPKAFEATKDLPEPGPPAIKKALNIPGS